MDGRRGSHAGYTSRPPYQPSNPSRRLKTGGIRVLQRPRVTSPLSNEAASASKGRLQHGDRSHTSHHSTHQPRLYRRIFYPFNQEADFVPPRILAARTTTPGQPEAVRVDELDAQLYDLLALVCKGYISPWYSKISRDRGFLLEIVRVASHVLRRLEAKLGDTDLGDKDDNALPGNTSHIDKASVLCEDLPRVFARHVQDWHRARNSGRSAYTAGATSKSIEIPAPVLSSASPDCNGQTQIVLSAEEVYFHSLQAHVAISTTCTWSSASAEPTHAAEKLPAYVDADYLRALVEALLKELLPPEDFAAETERSVIREVVVGIVLAGVLNKVAQPWFIHSLVAKTLESLQVRQSLQNGKSYGKPASIRPTKWSVLAIWTNIVALSLAISAWFLRATVLFTSVSVFVTAALAADARRPRTRRQTWNLCRPSLDAIAACLQSDSEGRQVIATILGATRVGTDVASPILDRVIVHFLNTRVFTRATVTRILDAAESALFPDGNPAPPTPDPDEEEQAALRDRAERALAGIMPGDGVIRLLFPGSTELHRPDLDEVRLELARQLLDPFSSQYCNVHLFLFILDLAAARLCPDLIVSL